MCQNHDMIVSHVIVGDSELILTTSDSFTVHLNLSTRGVIPFRPHLNVAVVPGSRTCDFKLGSETYGETPKPASYHSGSLNLYQHESHGYMNAFT